MSKVYFTDMRTSFTENLPKKLTRLIDRAGLGTIDFDHKFVAIKIHFGEMGNLAYLRPQYARALAAYIKERGGLPFLTDCNTLYVGSRKNALEHIETAYINGYTPYATGCQVIIADGVRGTDEAYIPIGCEEVKTAKIGRAIADADIIISLNHFKGHEEAGFGGALKNLGMGSGSRAGKMEMHYDGKPVVDRDRCRGCRKCATICANDGIHYENSKAVIDHDNCVGCGRCIAICSFDAIKPDNSSSETSLNKRIAEYAYAVVKDKPNFHISIAADISPNCDCHPENDTPIVNDIGMFASFDPVAIDQACADAVMASEPLPNTELTDSAAKMEHNHEHLEGEQAKDPFCITHPDTDWRSCIAHAEKIGLGTSEYELIEVK